MKVIISIIISELEEDNLTTEKAMNSVLEFSTTSIMMVSDSMTFPAITENPSFVRVKHGFLLHFSVTL